MILFRNIFPKSRATGGVLEASQNKPLELFSNDNLPTRWLSETSQSL